MQKSEHIELIWHLHFQGY